MKVTYNWLKEYVDFEWSAEELAERITMLGVEVEGIEETGGAFDGIVVGQVVVRDKHPNADKLTLCKVTDGKSELQIVCGATNFQAGDKVALAQVGTSMPVEAGEKPFVLKEGKIRGELSQGMMCSGRELKLNDDHEGILILPATAQLGQPYAEHLGRAGKDVVFDLEVTPNRPDLNGVIGLAREIAALTGNPLKRPEIPLNVSNEKADNLVAVQINDSDLCPRYNARVIRGVKIGPSPDWLRARLESIGIRPISNVVDVTNFVMMETGQPLHAFDLHLLAKVDGKPTVVVRRANAGEKFTTLDEAEHELRADNLLIADPEKGIALAGVMGGMNTEINDTTQDVLLETAYFNPQNIRATSKATKLQTDASYRFERGADLGVTDWASQRAAQLIAETAGGTVAEGAVDEFPIKPEPVEIKLRHARTDALLGITIEPSKAVGYLEGLGLETVSSDDDAAIFRIPTWRVDLKREVDLIEEVCRVHGVDEIPATLPMGCRGENEFDATQDAIAETRGILAGLGLNEAQGQSLISDTAAQLASSDIVELEYPLSSDMNVLRPSLLPGLLDSLRNNLTRQNHDVALFEIGRVFAPNQPEHRTLALLLTGKRHAAFWRGEDDKIDAMDLKGAVEALLDNLGVFGVQYERRTEATALFLESAELRMGNNVIGQMGQLLPPLGKKYEARDAVFLAELNLDMLLQRRTTNKSFKSLPQFPASERDVAMLVSDFVTHSDVLAVVKKTKPANLVDTQLFDVFRGKNVPDGQKSLAYSFTYRNAEKTLTDKDVNSAHDSLVMAFKSTLGATIRDN
ncbi:MAG: phenylalanine--tRNA ligase subunit beta [Verrucomicrobia subdivision 3 bacterium]|nr:phenylalanine--tRNA ligase subunit beta [Limisphaerales bacterium]